MKDYITQTRGRVRPTNQSVTKILYYGKREIIEVFRLKSSVLLLPSFV